MAPAANKPDPANAPLADYFFISGIESSQVYDAQRVNGAAVAPAESTIAEDAALEVEEEDAEPAPPRPSSSDGFSVSKRQSISSVIGPDYGPGPTASNRSSATIKGFPQIGGSGLSDFDFDQALRKFAAERETFLEEIQFSAGTLKQEDRPRPRPKTQRIVSEDAGSLGAGIGSIRRRISTIGRSQRNSSVMRNCKSAPVASCTHAFNPYPCSFGPYLEKNERIQLGHPCPQALPPRAQHAPPEEEIRARAARQISAQGHGR